MKKFTAKPLQKTKVISKTGGGGGKFKPQMCKYLALVLLLFCLANAQAQFCPLPSSGTTSINAVPNTYYPGTGTVAAGATTLTLGAVPSGYGSTPIAKGDLLLVIQMQGAEINFTNTDAYGDGVAGGKGSGYFNNANLMAGNMEYVVAANAVNTAGGSLTITNGLTNSYKTSAYSAGVAGQYTYQVIQVPVYYNLKLTGNINGLYWNGAVGGITILYAVNNLNLGGFSVDMTGRGFRGGGEKVYNLGTIGYLPTDYVQTSAEGDASKGEGIAGTPKYVYNSSVGLVTNAVEGYPGGSFARGAPGNAGGGGTDGHQPADNGRNTGGAGGGNGGIGGGGGNAFNSNLPVGGDGGAIFAQYAEDRVVMGGGGGAGTNNNGTGSSSGGAGGGIIIVRANAITVAGSLITSGDNGSSALFDGGGGAGAGGSILVSAASGLNLVTATAIGGKGGDTNPTPATEHGPGGGGAGGIIQANGTLAVATVTGGVNGTSLGNAYGATAGANGIIVQSVATPDFPLPPAPPIISGASAVCIGATVTLTGSGTANTPTSWATSDATKASISSTTTTSTVVTGVAVPSAIITYTNNGGCKVSNTVTVNPLPTITGTLTTCPAAGTTTLTGSGTPAAVTPWVSSNTAVATVSSTGVVNGVSLGSCNITYTDNLGCTKTVLVTVDCILPITLTSFTATPTANCSALLQWQTANELNSKNYIVQQSTDGVNYVQAASVVSKNDANGARYSYKVGSLFAGINYFRLKAIDADGKFTYSNITTVRSTCKGSINITPNPTSDIINIAGLQGKNSIQIFNTVGQKMTEVRSTDFVKQISLAAFAKGVYILRIVDAQGVVTNAKVVRE